MVQCFPPKSGGKAKKPIHTSIQYGTWAPSQHNKARIRTLRLESKIDFLCNWYSCVRKNQQQQKKEPTKMPLKVMNEISKVYLLSHIDENKLCPSERRLS